VKNPGGSAKFYNATVVAFFSVAATTTLQYIYFLYTLSIQFRQNLTWGCFFYRVPLKWIRLTYYFFFFLIDALRTIFKTSSPTTGFQSQVTSTISLESPNIKLIFPIEIYPPANLSESSSSRDGPS
jgi:hypothetical protein